MAIAAALDHEPLFLLTNDVTAGTWKTVLTTQPVSTAHDNISDLTQVANGNGYTTGGLSAQALAASAGGIVTIPQLTVTPSGPGFSYRSVYLARVSDGALWPVAWDEGRSVSVTVPRLIPYSQTAGILARV